jgi:hypothetical protein
LLARRKKSSNRKQDARSWCDWPAKLAYVGISELRSSRAKAVRHALYPGPFFGSRGETNFVMQQPMPNGSTLRYVLPRPVFHETGRIALKNVVRIEVKACGFTQITELKRVKISTPCR